MLRKLRCPYICLGLIVFLIIIFKTPALFAAEALLSWDPPNTSADGTTLTDLSGYIVHYGTESGNYTSSIDVGNITTYTISTLTAGVTYYFAATAYDTSGNESSYSNEVSANIPVPTPVDYYCDNDSDGYISSFISGSCTGTGCEPSGCQATAGNDCNDSNAVMNPGAVDDNCDGVDDNCDGTTDEGCAPVISVSKVLISEDFSQGIPATWAAQGAWNADNTCGKNIGSSFEGAFAIADSSCTQTHADELTTGLFNTVSCNSVNLIFSNQYYWYSGNIAVTASSDGGQTWASEHYADSNEGYPIAEWKELDISRIADSESAKIRFQYLNDSTDGFWAMDNVWVICQANQIAFSSQVGSASAPQEIMITNPGTDDLAIAAINLNGTGAADFSIGSDDSCSGQTLRPAETCIFEIIFLPLIEGSKAATLSISSNDPVNPTSNITLSGAATARKIPVPVIKANSSAQDISITAGSNLSVSIELDPKDYSGENADWWVLMEYRSRLYSYDKLSGKWRRGLSYYKQSVLNNLAPLEVINDSSLAKGQYTFYFGVDTVMNGIQDADQIYSDVVVNVE